MRRKLVALFLVSLLEANVSCGGATSPPESVPGCVPGSQAGCKCVTGEFGMQLCLESYTYGACECRPPGSHNNIPRTTSPTDALPGSDSYGSIGWSEAGGSATDSASEANGNQAPGTLWGTRLVEGTSELLDVFVGDRGFYVVTKDGVFLYGRNGAEIARITSAREITTAAFDGTTLVIADKAKLTSYGAGLERMVDGDLLEACASSVMLDGGRFICGPANDWDRVFYTYDTKTATLLASSAKYTYNGIPMKRIPGTNDFVTVTTGSSPSDFHLYTVQANGQAVYVNESPYHGDFRITDTYTFNSAPPTHLITDEGLLLRLCEPQTGADANVFESTCFVKDGALGTLTGAQSFVAMESTPQGGVSALVDPRRDSYDAVCDNGCLLQRIDVASRTVTSQATVHLDAGAIIAFRHDATGNRAVVGYRKPNGSRYYSPSEPYPGYQVEVFSY